MIDLYQAGGASLLVTSKPAMSLKQGEFSDFTNFINRYGVPEVRKSDTALSTTGITGTVFYGSWSGTISGVEYALFAIKNSTKVDIYDSTAASAWTKRSVSSGPYGDTRLDDTLSSTNGVTFQAIHDPVLGEAVIISDGTTVLLWQPSSVNGERLRKVQSVSSATSGPSSTVMVQTFNLCEVVNTTQLARTGTTWTAGSGANGVFVVNTPQSSGDTLEISLAPSGNLSSGGNQFAIFCTVPNVTYDFFSACKLELAQSGGGAYVTIFDPSTSSVGGIAPTVELFENYSINGISQTAMLVTYFVPNVFTNSFTKMKFTYKGTATQFAAGTLQIYGFVNGGTGTSRDAPPAGYQNYAFCYRNSATGVESAMKIMDSSNASGNPLWMYYSSSLGPSTLSGTFPVSNTLVGQWTVCDTTPLSVSSDGAFDQFCLYRKDSGSSDYFFVDYTTYTSWSGSAWALTAGTYSTAITDTKGTNALNYERPAPSAYNIAPVGFVCAGWANGRLFTGTTNEYKFSEYKYPLRYALTVDVNAYTRSSGGFRFASESPKQFFSLVGDANLDRIAIATDKGCYAISGLDTFSIMRPGRISQFGTNSPKSFSTRRETSFFLDDARRIHTFPQHQEFDKLSTNVKDILDGIPSAYISKACSGVFDDFYYLFYTPSGQTVNNRAIVIDLISGSLSRFSFSLGVTSVVVNGSRLLGFMSDGTILNIASGSSTVSGVSIATREYKADQRMGSYWSGKRQRIFVDDDPNTITASWTAYPSGSSVTDAALSENSAGSDVRTDRYTAINKAIRGKTIKFGLSGTMNAGTRLYEWQVEAEGRSSGADVS